MSSPSSVPARPPSGQAPPGVAPVPRPDSPARAPAEFITTPELCRRLGICRRTVLNHGLTRYALRVGSQWRFPWADILHHYGARDETPGHPAAPSETTEPERGSRAAGVGRADAALQKTSAQAAARPPRPR